jgi:hypothetical protein
LEEIAEAAIAKFLAFGMGAAYAVFHPPARPDPIR